MIGVDTNILVYAHRADSPFHDQALEVILKSHGLDKVLQGNVLRVAPVDKLKAERESFKEARVAEEELENLPAYHETAL